MLFDKNRGEMWVNSTGYANQERVGVVTLGDGGFLAFWKSFSSFGSSDSIRMQRFDSAGARKGGEITVTPPVEQGGFVTTPGAVALAGGGFALVWCLSDSKGQVYKVRTFAADGTQIGVDATIAGTGQYEPALTALAGGGFMLAWSQDGLKAQIFGSTGEPSGTVLTLKAGTFGTTASPALAALEDGRIVAAWWDPTPTGGQSSGEIRARLFNADGSPAGAEFLVNASVAGEQWLPTATALAGGGFVIGWASSQSGSSDVRARIFDSAAAPIGVELQVNTTLAGTQSFPEVAAMAGGGFIFTWSDYSGTREGTGGSGAAVVGQVFGPSGEKLGGEFLVNSSTKNDQSLSSMAVLPTGELVVMWRDSSLVGDSTFQGWGTEIRGQMFKPHVAITDISLSASSVSEVAFGGSAVATLGSNAAVNGDVRYEIVGDSSGGAFAVSGNQLVVANNARLDFETRPTVSVTIRAIEAGGISFDETFNISVTNSVGELRFEARDSVIHAEAAGTYDDAYAGPVVRLASGAILTVWTARESNVNRHYGQLVDDTGAKIGGRIAFDLANIGFESLVALSGGGFAMSWYSRPSTYDPVNYTEVMVQRFDPTGAALGPPAMVNTTVAGEQQYSKLASLSDGNLLVVWKDTQRPPESGQQGFGSVRAQLLDPAGEKVGGELLLPINAVMDGGFKFELASLPSGGFVLVWQTGSGLWAQLFDNSGGSGGAEFQVSAVRGGQWDPSIAVLDSGNFVVTWTDGNRNGWDYSDSSVRAQIFTPGGIKVGSEITVNTVTLDEQSQSRVVALPTGGFVVSWVDYSLYSSTSGLESEIANLKAQIFTEGGLRVGTEFQLNQLTAGSQYPGALVAGQSGSFLAFWSDEALDWGNHYVAMRSFRAVTPGTSGNDSMAGTAGPDILDSLGGDDRLDGGAGADSMAGGSGNDVYGVDDPSDIVTEMGGEGVDEVQTALSVHALAANVENLTATSDSPHDFRGNGGNNVITGGGAADVLRLHDGGDDTVLAGGGNDNIFLIGSLTAADVVNGGAGNDTLILQGDYPGGLTLTANVTNIELISILAGWNTNFGESGSGRYDYVLTTHDSNFSGAIQVRVNGSALLEGEDFTFDGSAELDSRFVVYGGRGTDTLIGSRNNDIFFLAEERFATGDTVNGGAGYDGMFLRGNYTIDFNAPGYTGLFTNIENLTLTSATDERYARGGGTEFDYNLVLSNAIVKPGEILTISGTLLMAGETMILDGSAETDGILYLFGGRSDDTLKGGGQADILHGNLGADQLMGNGSADSFRYQAAAESTTGSVDHILDFEVGADKVDLSRIDADTVAAGDQAFGWIGSNAFSGAAGQLRAYEQSGTWFVEGDVDGDSVADLVIALTLQGPASLGAGDFLL